MTYSVGDMVVMPELQTWVRKLPAESRRVLESCVGRPYPIAEIGDDGHLVLDVSADIDHRFGGTMNDIRVEPERVRPARGDSPADLRSLFQEGIGFVARDEVENALARFQEGLRLARSRDLKTWIVRFSRNAGLVCDHAGRLEEAREWYCIAAEEDPEEPGIHFVLGELHRRLGDHNLAREHLQKAHTLDDDPELAAAIKEKLLSLYPDTP